LGDNNVDFKENNTLARAHPLLLGCAHSNSQSYADAVLNRPMRPDNDARMRECGWIRSEIARQQGLTGAGATAATTPFMVAGLPSGSAAERRGTGVKSRNIQCTAAFGNAPAVARAAGPSFDQCFARCQQYTDCTKDQCLDACNK
jgi:hypothetical protein